MGREHIPYPQGSHTVGVTDIMSPQGKDGVFIRLYYPTEDCDLKERHSQWPRWSPKAQYLESYGATIYNKMLSYVSSNLKVPVIWGGEILKDLEFPVVLFSHGLGGNRTCYSYICSDLASHGFIVASVEHRDGSASTTYYVDNVRGAGRSKSAGKQQRGGADHTADADDDDVAGAVGEVAQMVEKFMPFKSVPKDKEQELTIRKRQVAQRSNECVSTLDLLTKINSGQHLDNMVDRSFKSKHFKGSMDLSSVAIMGHSFGGATVLQALADDSRFKVGVCLDVWMFPLAEDIADRLHQPILMINSEDFHWSDNISRMKPLDTGTDDRMMLTIRGTNHQNQTDFSFLVGGMVGRMCKAHGSLDPYVAADINNQAVIAFLCIHLDLGRIPLYENSLFIESEHVFHGTNVKASSKKKSSTPKKSWSPFKKSPKKDKKPKPYDDDDDDGDDRVVTPQKSPPASGSGGGGELSEADLREAAPSPRTPTPTPSPTATSTPTPTPTQPPQDSKDTVV